MEEALDCLRAALHSLNSSSKIGGEMLKNKLGKGTMQDLDDLLHSETVHKQVRRIFKATRHIISKHKPMRLIEEIMKWIAYNEFFNRLKKRIKRCGHLQVSR